MTLYGPELAAHWLGDLRTRVIQHNIRTLARYYKRVRLSRAAELLSLSVAEVGCFEVGRCLKGGAVVCFHAPLPPRLDNSGCNARMRWATNNMKAHESIKIHS